MQYAEEFFEKRMKMFLYILILMHLVYNNPMIKY